MNQTKLKVFYNSNQSTDKNDSLSPSAGKPKIIAEEFAKNSLVEVVSGFHPLLRSEISVAHDKDHVDDVLNCVKNNGFRNKIKEVADTLPWTNGSFYAAADHAWKHKEVTMSPTSGFHHAEWRLCEGFCTFNGLMISAILLKERNPEIKRIGIIDIDAHYGNGTDDIIKVKDIDYIQHYTFGAHADVLIKNNIMDRWLGWMKLNIFPKFKDCDIVLYQAGGDPHVNDPYGGYLTTEQMLERDYAVFEFCKQNNIPIAWNLAGGYQKPIEKVIELHMNTLDACLNVFCSSVQD